MALVGLLRINTDGLQVEHDPANDEIDMLDIQLGGVAIGINTPANVDGPTVINDDAANYTNFTPAGNTLRETLEAIDTKFGTLDFSDCEPYTNGEASPITLGQVVYISANDTVMLADSSNPAKDNPVGIVGDASIAAAASGNICYDGVVVGALSGATAGDKYFLNSSGALSTSIPAFGSGENVVFMGYAKNATDIHLQIQNIGRRR